MRIFLILISLLVLPNSSPDHQDTRLQIDKDGNIKGLPKKYLPAKFNFEDRYLRINDRELTFPSCLDEFLENTGKNEVKLSASWYHSKDILPYYLNMDIGQIDEDYEYSLLVNLKTLEFMELRKITVKESSMSRHEIDLDKQCLNDYKKSVKKLE